MAVAGERKYHADQRMSLAREWYELVDQVRRLPGFEDFLRPPRLDGLLPAVHGGPVVLVNVSRLRCDALIVREQGVENVDLPGLMEDEVNTRARDYLITLLNAENAAGALMLARKRIDQGDATRAAVVAYDAAKRSHLAARLKMENNLAEVATWLWDAVAEPVMNALGHTTPVADPPRVWWCPTGLLSLLPLHAAGHHDENDGRTVLDRVVSSYTPTLRALRETRNQTSTAERRMLVVALPEAPGQAPLPAVTRERDLLVRLFADNHTLLEGSAATWAAVLSELAGHAWVHLSCHGDQDLTEPARGGVLLHDRLLTIGEISAAEYGGEFAFLSACKTATGGFGLADEAITLAAALHYTGYRHVIGTLWSIYDTTAATVSESVYTSLTAGGSFNPAEAARALHQAVLATRETAGGRLSTWMPFTHTGP